MLQPPKKLHLLRIVLACRYTTSDTGEAYYHNSMTNETVWDKPREWQ